MITDILKSTWSLFLGMLFLMLGNGLQGTLVSWRATHEGFSASTTGWIMTAYYLGFLAGSLLTVKLIRKVGHVRVFAALASMASTAVLVQILIVTPSSWLIMRLITGFCFAGTYVIVESWLNERADNNTRGQVLSFYMFVTFLGLAGGQWLFNVADPTNFSLFLLVSILLSFALVPVLITKIEAPEIIESESMSLRKLYKIAPAGVTSIMLSSIVQGAMFGMGAVFASNAGMSVSQTAIFMSVFIGLGAFSHWPLGWLSDKIDRRLVVVGASFTAFILSFVLLGIDNLSTNFVIIYGFLGAMILPVYSLGVAHINDRLRPDQMTNASSTIVLLFGIGAAIGPISVGYILNIYGNFFFLIYIGAFNLLLTILVLFWIFRREAVPDEEQVDYQLVPSVPTAVAMEAVAQEVEDTINDADND